MIVQWIKFEKSWNDYYVMCWKLWLRYDDNMMILYDCSVENIMD